MSPNRFLPHVLVLPEDDANRELVLGFLLDSSLSFRSIDLLGVAGGWIKVLDSFESNEIAGMRKYQKRFIVLVFDFDNDASRLSIAAKRIPEDLVSRVFILGSMRDPESLKRSGLGNFEEIGLALAKDCRENTDTLWGHELLRHNSTELARLRERVRPILFPAH
jgi:hypothetical protein